MNFYEGYHFYGMHLIWWAIWAVFILLVFTSTIKSSSKKLKEETPLDILNKRYASGEITQEEFEEKKKTLNI